MIICRYTLGRVGDTWQNASFELRIKDDDRPFHLAIRAARERLALNSMAAGGHWGQEQSHPLPVAIADLRTLVVDVMDDRVSVMIAGIVHDFHMSVSQNDVSLRVAAHNMSWSLENLHPAPDVGGPPDAGLKPGARDLAFGGTRLTLPSDVAPEQANRLMTAVQECDSDTWLAFLGGLDLGSDPTIVDLAGGPFPVLAFLTARLLPGARVHAIAGPAEDGIRDTALIAALARCNGLTNLTALNRADVAGVIGAAAQNGVVVLGDGVFDRFGHVIDGLSAPQRARLGLFSREPAPVSGARVFPCATARIAIDTDIGPDGAPDWVLHHGPAPTDQPPRRAGLDIVIAAYNAAAYLVHCAESLLCKGCDDIRVIIVDDGSTDGCGDMARAHFTADPRVRVVRKANGGCASARNYGRLVSNASHIAFVDADDFVTPNCFADLYDLSLYSGRVVVQAGFDFYNDQLKRPFYTGAEDEKIAPLPRRRFGGLEVVDLTWHDIATDQPSIWRRVYRRDFLDRENITFPENVRAYDDYVFQMFTLVAAGDVAMLPDHRYHYRQHPDQDIRQGDERHFYMLHMLQMILRRSIDAGWPDFAPFAASTVGSIGWSAGILRPDLITSFLSGAARLCVAINRVHGPGTVSDDMIDRVPHADFAYHYRHESEIARDLPDGMFWAWVRGPMQHPDMLKLRQGLRQAQ